MTANNTQNDKNPTTNSDNSNKKAAKVDPKKIGIVGALALMLAVTGFVAVSMSGSNSKTPQVAQNSSVVSSSTSVQNQALQNSQSVETNPITGEIQTAQAAAPNPVVDRYLETTTKAKVEGRTFEPLEATKEEIKQIVGEEALKQSEIKLQKGQEKVLKIGYTNSGDEPFKAGTMIVKLDKELKFKKEAKDSFDGQVVNLSPSVFVSDNEIRIAKNALSVGQRGEVEVTVIVPEGTPSGEYTLRSMLAEDGSNKGVPGFAYIQVD